MPNLNPLKCKKERQYDRSYCDYAIRKDKHLAPIPAVNQGSGEWTQDDLG